MAFLGSKAVSVKIYDKEVKILNKMKIIRYYNDSIKSRITLNFNLKRLWDFEANDYIDVKDDLLLHRKVCDRIIKKQ